jgi:hypothetical protein
MPDDADKAVFGQRAGRPSRPVIRQEKILGPVMMFMVGIGDSDQYIDVEEKHGGQPESDPLALHDLVDQLAGHLDAPLL